MKSKIFIITNESIYINENKDYFCDNIDLKSIPENLNKFSEVNIIGRNSKKKRSKKIELKNIKISSNIIQYLINLYNTLIDKVVKYLIISLSPYTFIASILLKVFFKKHFIYLRSDGFEEYKAIFGKIGFFLYFFIFKIGIINSNLIACREHLLRRNEGSLVNPSQLKDKWFQNINTSKPASFDLLYVGRLRVEKGIFSLIKIIENTNLKLTIVTPEKEISLDKNYNNIKLISFDNYKDAIIEFYDKSSILILPSYTKAHPQVLDEALARCRPVVVFNEIAHVKRNRDGVFVCKRSLSSLNETINYIEKNYDEISKKIQKNKLPTQKKFIDELLKILSIK